MTSTGHCPPSYLAAVSVLTSGHNPLSRFLWELGKRRGEEVRGQGGLPSTNQSKALGEARRKGRGLRRGGWQPKDRPLPFLRQMDTFLLVIRKDHASSQAWEGRGWEILESLLPVQEEGLALNPQLWYLEDYLFQQPRLGKQQATLWPLWNYMNIVLEI